MNVSINSVQPTLRQHIKYNALTNNLYAQEYLAYLQSLEEKVTNKKLSGNDARVKLATHLNDINKSYQTEMMQRDQIDAQQQQLE